MNDQVLDERDRSLAQGAPGALGVLNRAGLLGAADVHVAMRLGRLGDEQDERVLLAVALTVRAVRAGSVCLDLAGAAAEHGVDGGALLPDPEEWWAAVERSPLLGTALQREGGLLYLDRYWREEEQVVRTLRARAGAPPPVVDETALAAALAAAFPEADSADQRLAAETAVRSWTSVITGGPGTGKTTTVARLLGVLHELAAAEGRSPRVALAAPTGKAAAQMTEALGGAAGGAATAQPGMRVALAAPTGKAAARLQESVREQAAGLGLPPDLPAMTLHRLLGWRPDSRTRFRHDRGNPLPHDVVVVDETSMISLTMTARLLEAVRPAARLVLVGDADQLASVEAGAVLTDLVDGYGADPGSGVGSPVVRLDRSRRFGKGIGALADAVRRGDEQAVLSALAAGGPVTWVQPEDATNVLEAVLTDHALALHRAAEAGDAAAALRAFDAHRLLCAHRSGPYGVAHWNREVERHLQDRLGRDWLPEWYAGRPFLVNGNDHGLQLFNGDTGVVCRAADGGLVALLGGAASDGAGPRRLATTRLADVTTAHAMTVHRSQGSQFRAVTLLLPEPSSRILTRELLYTAVTRATTEVTVVGAEDAVRAAVSRRARRATGLGERLA